MMVDRNVLKRNVSSIDYFLQFCCSFTYCLLNAYSVMCIFRCFVLSFVLSRVKERERVILIIKLSVKDDFRRVTELFSK